MSNSSTQLLRYFSIAWGLATLFHFASYHLLFDSSRNLAICSLAVAVCILPERTWLLVALLAMEVWEFWRTMPFLSNHAIIALLVAGEVLLAAVACRIHRRQPGFQNLFDVTAPGARAIVLIFYFFVAFHKLNSGYFNVECSCGSVFLTKIAGVLHLPPRLALWLTSTTCSYAAILSSVGLELFIPALLVTRRTRQLGIAIGAIFHSVLALAGDYFNFSALMLALYIFFLPTNGQFPTSDIDARTRWRRLAWLLLAIISPLAMRLPAGGMTLAERIGWQSEAAVEMGYRMLFLVYLVVFLRMLWRIWPSGESGQLAGGIWPKSGLLYVPIVLCVLNGASPYLGLKTESSFAMYSNLVTEGGRSNHFIIRGGWQLAGYQDDLVEIKATSNHRLEAFRQRSLRMTYFEFRDYLYLHPNASVSYLRNGQKFDVGRAGDYDEFSQPTPWLERKLLLFRLVSEADCPECSH